MTQLVTLEGQARPAAPPAPWRLIAGERPLVFVVDGSRLFGVEPEFFAALQEERPEAQQELLGAVVEESRQRDFAAGLPEPAAISLNIAQSCNLACTYCYADEGRFGGAPQFMPLEVALQAIDRLVEGARGRRVTVGFIGGEPFLNREVLYGSVEHARERARAHGCTVGFSVTTNGTLLNADDVRLLRERGFAVSVSLDGGAALNDRHRRARNGASGFEAALAGLRPLLENPGKARVAARATIARDDLCVAERVEALAAAGFIEIGVSPLRTGPDASLVLRDADWPRLLEEMMRAAEQEWRRVRAGAGFRFSNLATAMKQLHTGSAKPLPCGSAANYVSVSAQGGYFTCHRTIDDRRFSLGTVDEGLSGWRRESFLQERHVDRQEPCRTCWARYLCGGGCHAEVLSAGRSGCDYIRGWLEYCLRFYDRVLRERPGLLGVEVV
ncbi:MAG: radical SAM protein [Acidobacteriia bacterium]|nr:radical SAM protein [Terriglobia bacterium]